jgi:hypothetical protein
MVEFYTYLYRDPKTYTPRYVGKGSALRAWKHLEKSSNLRLHNMIQKRLREGFDVQPEIATKGDEEWAFFVEEEMIAKYGRLNLGTGTLFNRTDGGEGVRNNVGRKQSAEARKNMRAAWEKRAPMSEETKARMKEAWKTRKPASIESRQKMRASRLAFIAANKGK